MHSQRRAIVDALEAWHEQDVPAALATVVSTDSSAPRGLGAQLAMRPGRLWVGAVSGGCAEVELLEQADRLCAAGATRQNGSGGAGPGDDGRAGVFMHMTHDTLGATGPVCGATLGVIVERVDGELREALADVARRTAHGAAASIVRTYCVDPSAGSDELTLHRTGVQVASAEPLAPRRGALELEQTAEQLVVREQVPAAPHVVIGGAGDVSAELVRLLGQLGWRSTLVDPRAGFVEQMLANVQPDAVHNAWVQEVWSELGVDAGTACVALAHDAKLDVPFLLHALASDAFYVGLIGSRLVQHERRAQLAQDLSEEQLARLAGPAGLNLGGSAAAEIALSIAAEMLATLNDRTGTALSATSGPIRA